VAVVSAEAAPLVGGRERTETISNTAPRFMIMALENEPSKTHQRPHKWRNLFFTLRDLRRIFPESQLDLIEQAVTSGEKLHRAELRIVIEGRLSALELFCGLTSRARAINLFSALNVWDTADNSGVLLYVLLAERSIEIVADRQVHELAQDETWNSIIKQLELEFKNENHAQGLLTIIETLNSLLARHFPAVTPRIKNELTNRPLLVL